MKKIIVTSDLHGCLPQVDEKFDLLLICGDVCPAHDHFVSYQKDWLTANFVEWIKSLPFNDGLSRVVMTWGNHDFFGERCSKEEMDYLTMLTGGRLIILRHDIYEFEYPVSDGADSLTIFGTPYCSLFGSWAFMINDDSLDKKFSQIPENVDILISHDSPKVNGLGAIREGPWKNEDTGNRVLGKHIERVAPKMFFSGHFHSGNHEPEYVNGTLMANVSLVNEAYTPNNDLLIINYNEETRTIDSWEKKWWVSLID